MAVPIRRSRRSRSNPASTPRGEVVRRINGHPTEPFVYKNKGIMATIGRRSAVTELPSGIAITGTLGWLSWLFLHLLYLVGFRNRLSVLLNWAWSYATHERGPRLIFDPDELNGPDRPDLTARCRPTVRARSRRRTSRPVRPAGPPAR